MSHNCYDIYILPESVILWGFFNSLIEDSDLSKQIKNLEHKLIKLKPFLRPNITLEHMAGELGISAPALSLLLKEFYHTNFYQFVNQHRIGEAKRLLLCNDTGMHIAQIYTLAGFTSRTTFNVKFKQLVGVTPSDFRRQHETNS